ARCFQLARFNDSLLKVAKCIDPPVAKERPDLTEFLNRLQVTVDDKDFILIDGCPCDDLPVRIAHKRLSPKLGVSLVSHAVHRRDVAPVCYAVPPLYRLPCTMLG